MRVIYISNGEEVILDVSDDEKILNLREKDITSIKFANYDFSNLQTLCLSNNQLTSIDKVSWPPNLQTLYLFGNQLTSIDVGAILEDCKKRYNINIREIVEYVPLYKVLKDCIAEMMIR